MIRTEHGYARLYKVYGRTETEVRERLGGILKEGGAAIVSLRKRGPEIHVLAETKTEDEKEARELTKKVGKNIRHALGDWCYSTREEETLAEATVRLLLKYGLTVSTAESCTGGLTAARLIDVSGVSAAFGEGYVTYSNKAKRKLLGVKKTTLRQYGAVSRETALEMAAGAAQHAVSDVAVSTTGIAGPDGGTEEKPVGLVYIGAHAAGKTEAEKHIFAGSRAEVREQAAMAAIDLLRRMILWGYGR